MSSFPPTLWLAAPQGMHGHPGLCSCARSGVAPRVLEGLVPLGRCKGDEVFRVARAARNTLWELCALWKVRTPLKSIETYCRTVRPAVALGWPQGCRGRRVRGHRGCPVPQGCQWVNIQAGGSTQSSEYGGTAWGQLGMWGWKVWGQGNRVFSSQRVLVCMVMHLHPCSHVQVCMAWSFPWSLLWGGKGSGCRVGVKPLAGFWVCPGEHRLCLGPYWPPDPPDTPRSLPQALLWLVLPSCTRCQPPSCWEGSAPFITTSCPFRLSALSFIVCKSSLGPSCAQVRVWAL